jgi:putative nucleotidyltransferase with HDIG domain
MVRERHLDARLRRERLTSSDPAGARQAHLEQQLTVAARLTSAMSASVDADEIARNVVTELHETFDVYLAVIQRLDPDGVLRIVAGAGPLADVIDEFLLHNQPVTEGVNGRVARTCAPALIADTRLDPDYAVRDPHTDPRSELSLPILVEGQVWGVLNLEEVRTRAFDQTDVTLMELIAAQLGATFHRCRLYRELEGAFATTLTVLCSAAEANDAYTAAHEQDVAVLAAQVGVELGLDAADLRALRYAALTHDLGKLVVPSEILNKRGPLDDREWAVMRRHTVVGADLLRQIPFFAAVHPLVRSHHERWDGTGYPDGLSGTHIPVGARILAVCDAYNAMVTDRPYRDALPKAQAVAELRANAGTQFDASVVAALLRALDAAGDVRATSSLRASMISP